MVESDTVCFRKQENEYYLNLGERCYRQSDNH
jgi:hypothetical protein